MAVNKKTFILSKGKEFNTLEDWENFKRNYEKQEMIKFSTDNSKSLQSLKNYAELKRDIPTFNEKLKFYHSKFVCSKGGKYRPAGKNPKG